MEVHVAIGEGTAGAVYECKGDHFHRPPVTCVGDQVICGNNDGKLSSINLVTGRVHRSPKIFHGGWPSSARWQMDPSGRFIRVDTIAQVVNPVTLELLDEADAIELPVRPCEYALPNDFDSVETSVPQLASHTKHGSTRSWRRQCFQTDFGIVVTSFDSRTNDYKIHCAQATYVLTLLACPIDGGASVHLTFTNLAGEIVFEQSAGPEEELTLGFWGRLVQQAGTPNLRLVLPGSRVISKGDLMQGLTFASLVEVPR